MSPGYLDELRVRSVDNLEKHLLCMGTSKSSSTIIDKVTFPQILGGETPHQSNP